MRWLKTMECRMTETDETARKSEEIKRLLSLLDHEDPLVQGNVLQILRYKCEDPNTRLLIKKDDGICRIEGMLQSDDSEVTEPALEALIKLWQLTPPHVPHIGAVGYILKHGSRSGKYSAVMALTYFTKYPGWFVRLGAVTALFNLLKDAEFTEEYQDSRQTIIYLLQVVANSREGKRAVGAKLADLLLQPSSPAEVRDAAVIADQFKLSLQSSPLLGLQIREYSQHLFN